MPAASEGLAAMRAYLLNERPDSIASANQLAKRFGVEQNSAIRVLEKAHYTKRTDSPVWHSPNSATFDARADRVHLEISTELLKKAYESLSDEDLEGYYSLKNAAQMKRELARLLVLVFNQYESAHLLFDLKGLHEAT